mmetsp:Transcript_40290/g.113934  ORF Transcript_40290/g.113934 Transcript_40290/m.113934 type:complete len:139 (+) Transcript_40290:71-487(+)
MGAPALEQDLLDIISRYGVPESTQKLMREKAVISVKAIADTFEDDTQFTEFLGDEATLRVKLALRMVYFDALECAESRGQVPRRAKSPASSSSSASPAPSPEPPEEEEEEDGNSSDDDRPEGQAPSPAPDKNGQVPWR